MSADILNFLNEVDAETVRKVFSYIRRRDVKVQFKTPDSHKVETVQFLATESAHKINLVFKNKFELVNDEITFKIIVGTDVYFFKGKVIRENKDYYVYGPFKIFKLMRRKSTRFAIPENWLQVGFIIAPQKRTLNSKIQLLEISSTGMRFLVYPQLPLYKKKQKIELNFKIQKRSAITVDAIIMHAKYNKLGGPILGVEFILKNQLIKNKIQNICDDLSYALAQNLAVKL